MDQVVAQALTLFKKITGDKQETRAIVQDRETRKLAQHYMQVHGLGQSNGFHPVSLPQLQRPS
jgi:hypothetical protein